jgi:hypothetical protein
MLSPYSTSSNNHYPSTGYESAKRITDPMQNYGGNQLMDIHSRGPNQNNAAYTASSVTLGQKRGGEARHPSLAKVPRLDTWKQTIDQEIEQRFSSYTSSKAQHQQQQQQQQHSSNHQQHVNGNIDGARHDPQYTSSHHHHHQQSLLHHQSQQPNQHHPSGHPRATAPAAATSTNQPQYGYRSTPQPSPYVPNPGHQQYPTPHLGSQPMAQQPPPSRGQALQRLLTTTSSGLLQQQTGGMNSSSAGTGGMADKRVLSILRNSLELKEARMTELQNQLQQNQLHQQQQQQQPHHQNRQMSNQYQQLNQQTNQPPPLSESPVQILAHRKPSSAPAVTGKHNLSSFGVTVDTNNTQKAAQIQTHKIHVPKAIESVPFEAETESVTSRMSNSSAAGVARTDVLENNHGVSVSSNGSSSGDPDGFAAYLAARIRTKAELKQVRY